MHTLLASRPNVVTSTRSVWPELNRCSLPGRWVYIPGQVVEESDDEDDDGVASPSDAVEVLRSHERSADTREAINGHQHHHPDSNRLCISTPNTYYPHYRLCVCVCVSSTSAVCLSVCLSVCPDRSITQKRMIPKCSNLVEGMTLGYPTRRMVLGWKIKDQD